MNNRKIQLLLTGVAVWISFLVMITTTYGRNIVMGGNSTAIGTIVLVSPNPGDTAQANGTALLNSLAAITGNANTPYVIRLGPGIYNIGTSSLQMKPYVDLEGSGENTTVITGNIDSNTSGVVQGASNAEIRFLTVQNTGGGSDAIAIYNTSASPKMTNVTASASGAVSNCGVFNISSSSPVMLNVTASGSGGTDENCGVHNHSSSSPMMTNVTASALGGTGSTNAGIVNCSSSPTMTNVTVSASGGAASYGVFSDSGGTIRINHSVIKGKTNAVVNGSGTVYVGNTQLDGGVVSGTLTCVGAYDDNYVALNTSCQH